MTCIRSLASYMASQAPPGTNAEVNAEEARVTPKHLQLWPPNKAKRRHKQTTTKDSFSFLSEFWRQSRDREKINHTKEHILKTSIPFPYMFFLFMISSAISSLKGRKWTGKIAQGSTGACIVPPQPWFQLWHHIWFPPRTGRGYSWTQNPE